VKTLANYRHYVGKRLRIRYGKQGEFVAVVVKVTPLCVKIADGHPVWNGQVIRGSGFRILGEA
jgi:hypothetical protein